MADHPITPPPELVRQWDSEAVAAEMPEQLYIATQAARWGADQELEACCEWAAEQDRDFDLELRAARRPNPPSLKEQALQALGHLDKGAELQMDTTEAVDTIRRALEALDG